MKMNRKDFLKTVTLAGAAVAAGSWTGGIDVFAQTNETTGACDLAAVLGGESDVMFQKAIAEFGGMNNYVKKGQTVVIKPNIGWDRSPEFAANTNPILIKEMVKQCIEAGAKEVMVFDHTCDNPAKCYESSGIEKAVTEAGGKMLSADDESYYVDVELKDGKTLKKIKVFKALVDCDVWFNVPVLKTHGGAQMTIALKNYMGIVWDRGIFHRQGLHQCIADSATFVKRPALNIVDAYRTMKDFGPRGKSLEYTAVTKALFVSPDIVAVDTAAVKFFNQVAKMSLEAVEHIKFAEELGLGSMDLDKMKNLKRINAAS